MNVKNVSRVIKIYAFTTCFDLTGSSSGNIPFEEAMALQDPNLSRKERISSASHIRHFN
jgi:hypothetical protein